MKRQHLRAVFSYVCEAERCASFHNASTSELAQEVVRSTASYEPETKGTSKFFPVFLISLGGFENLTILATVVRE